MKVATIIKTGELVEVVAVNGGWTTVHTLGADTREMKLRNNALADVTEMSDVAAELAMKKAERSRAAKAPRAPRAKKPINERQNGVVDALYLPQYQGYKVEIGGRVRRSMDKGDSVAQQLRGMTYDEVYKFASKIVNASVSDLRSRFDHLNPGMQRMNLGNMIRKAMKEAAHA